MCGEGGGSVGNTCKPQGYMASTEGQCPLPFAPGFLKLKLGPLGHHRPSPTPGYFPGCSGFLASFCTELGNIWLWPHGNAGQHQADRCSPSGPEPGLSACGHNRDLGGEPGKVSGSSPQETCM